MLGLGDRQKLTKNEEEDLSVLYCTPCSADKKHFFFAGSGCNWRLEGRGRRDEQGTGMMRINGAAAPLPLVGLGRGRTEEAVPSSSLLDPHQTPESNLGSHYYHAGFANVHSGSSATKREISFAAFPFLLLLHPHRLQSYFLFFFLS